MPLGYGAPATVGESLEPASTTGTIFDGTDSYPNDINTATAGTTFRLRASGSPYGSSTSVLDPPQGVSVLPYNGETVVLNGRIEVTNDDVTIGGIELNATGSAVENEGAVHLFSNTATAIDNFTLRHCHIKSGGNEHTVAFVGNVTNARVYGCEIERSETNTWSADGSDPGELWGQDNNSYYPDGCKYWNNKLVSLTGGTSDALQFQDCGKMEVWNCSFTGDTDENWADFKDGNLAADYYIYRCDFPQSPSSSTITSRAAVLFEECLFNGNTTLPSKVECGVSGQTTPNNVDGFKVLRCRFPNQGTNDSTHRVIQVIETVDLLVAQNYFDGGDLRIQSTGSGVVIRGNYIDDMDLDNSGSYTCENNLLTGGAAGWSSCTGSQ